MHVSASVSSHLFWVLSRGAGATALVLSSAAVGVGLIMGGRLIRGGIADRRAYHEALALAAIVAIAVHILALLGDDYLHPTLIDVTVPFVLSYQTLATSVGIIAAWGLICLGPSFSFRKRIGLERWKLIHRFTALAWLAGLVHTFAEGTDRGQLWFIALIALTAAPTLALLVWRLVAHHVPGPQAVPSAAIRSS
jgi:sulfoxide reductase heme-binding subunit YedZ